MSKWRRDGGSGGSRWRTTQGVLLVAALTAVLLVGCREESTTATPGAGGSTVGSTQAAAAAGDFGSLSDVCQKGDAKGATAQGVTDTDIKVGVISDIGFTQNKEFPDTAKAFTDWCNAAGGINGRKISFEVRDTKLFEYRQRILDACQTDFVLVGGSGALESQGTTDRVKCLLPEIPGQVISFEDLNADLQVLPYNGNPRIDVNEGYWKWLLGKYPDSKDGIGIIAADVGITQLFAKRSTETFEKNLGAKVTYNDVYPPLGPADWTPYARKIADSGVKGMVFYGDAANLAKLEQALVDIDYDLDWFDAGNNGYSQGFIKTAAGALDEIKNYSPPFVYPVEDAAHNPATQQLVDILKQQVPDAVLTGSMVNAWSAWLIFARAAGECGSQLTRSCLLEKARSFEEWDGGGLTPTIDLGNPTSTKMCMSPVEATSEGWTRADFGQGDAKYLCADLHELTTEIPPAVTLASVGLSMNDLK